MFKKLILIILSLSFAVFVKSQSLSFEAGASTFSSGAGVMFEFRIWKIGISAGVGSVLNNHFLKIIRPGGGLRFYIIDTKIGSPYLCASYGRTDYFTSESEGVITNIEIKYGPAFGGGFKFLLGKRKNFLIRVGIVAALQPKPSIKYQVLQPTSKWIVAPDASIGYQLSFKKKKK